MKAGKYTIKELFSNRNIDQIIIPEIQRDYVWGKDQVEGILDSVFNDFEKYNLNKSQDSVQISDESLKELVNIYYLKQKYGSNIGFIYAYNDKEYNGKYFLIDGQQRITTFYILLLALASENKQLLENFEKIYLNDEYLKLDYKVREASHEFLGKFVHHILKGCNDIENQNWYYKEYEKDSTISSVLANYKFIKSYIKNKQIIASDFYNYIENFVEFWYFDTNVSEQGEELYIYMNARGEQMQGNENIKADLLSREISLDAKDEFGRKWEDWQDFFWKHRGKNENADNGFNEFLACISGLERFINDNTTFYTKKSFERHNQIKTKDIIQSIYLKTIEKYINTLKSLESRKIEFKQLYNYADWVDIAINDIWDLFNDNKTNWFADYQNANRASERNRMVYLWSIFHYLVNVDLEKQDVTEMFRVLRFYHLKYKNYIRSVTTIKVTVNHLIIKSILQIHQTDEGIVSKEDIDKINLLNKYEGDLEEQRRVESVIWEIEDIPMNKNGRDVGGINVSHLVDLENTDIENLKLVLNKFKSLFTDSNSSNLDITLLNVLLYFGEYWERVSPTYYSNYKFDNWRKIIRNDIFSAFFQEYMLYNDSLENFRQTKKKDFNDLKTLDSLQEQLIFYSQLLGNKMWNQGKNIAISHDGWSGLHKEKNKGNRPDSIFPLSKVIFNTKGNLKGGKPTPLFSLLSDDQKKPFIEINKTQTP